MSLKLKWHKKDKSLKLKVHQNEMSPKQKYHQNWNVSKTVMSPKLEFFGKTDMSPKQKCHLNWNITLTIMSLRMKGPQNLTVTKTWMSTKLKHH